MSHRVDLHLRGGFLLQDQGFSSRGPGKTDPFR